jgi:Flp pilus assembly protein CpaB
VVDIAQNLFSTRRGSILVGIGAAVLAAIVVFVYLHNYRNSVNSAAAPASVLVAKNLIQKGTPGEIIGQQSQFQVASIPKKELQVGALTDPAALNGRIAAVDIYPGQQFTAADFVLAPPGTLQNQITGDDRAINISIDPQHGMAGEIGAGDRIDIFVGLNVAGPNGGTVIKLLLANVLVLRAPIGGAGGIYTLRVPEAQAAWLAYAADNGRLWFVLRPPNGARVSLPGIVTARTLLLGYKAVK